RLYSTCLMWLLGQFYYRMPEVGDPEKPKLVFFFDEAHQLFDDASSALVEHIEQVARLIRSKGIGVFFITQTPKDVDEDVLAQLGNRVQHAIRAYTPKDAKNLKATASTFPPSEFVDVVKSLTTLGIGEALVSVLDPRGVPTPVATAQILGPSSSMTAIDDAGYTRVITASAVATKYATPIDRDSAHEILERKLAEAAHEEREAADERPDYGAPVSFGASRGQSTGRRASAPRPRKSAIERVAQNAVNQAARSVTQQLVRGIFGMLKGR
ncbi:MAG: double-strand break repair helicase HerA and related ATPase, partial [Acidobacteriota bacterium]|nr:double-strand break repair helicase HerA and related ATPase [Acidobacteriota bacterium]